MLNNKGKINILVIIIIVLLWALSAGGLYIYFTYIKPPATPEKSGLQPVTVAPPSQPPIVNPPNPAVSPSVGTRDASKSGSTFGGDSDSYSGGKDYVKDFALFALGKEPLTVNLSGQDQHFLIIAVVFEYRLTDKELPAELSAKTPVFKDRLLQYFSKLTIDDVKEMNNRDIFKGDIMKIINNSLIKGRITDVIFDQFMFQ
jgi:flagellar basal body-associated protein FliL